MQPCCDLVEQPFQFDDVVQRVVRHERRHRLRERQIPIEIRRDDADRAFETCGADRRAGPLDQHRRQFEAGDAKRRPTAITRPSRDLDLERAISGTEAHDLGDAAALHGFAQVAGVERGNAVNTEDPPDSCGEEAAVHPVGDPRAFVDIVRFGILRDLGRNLALVLGRTCILGWHAEAMAGRRRWRNPPPGRTIPRLVHEPTLRYP